MVSQAERLPDAGGVPLWSFAGHPGLLQPEPIMLPGIVVRKDLKLACCAGGLPIGAVLLTQAVANSMMLHHIIVPFTRVCHAVQGACPSEQCGPCRLSTAHDGPRYLKLACCAGGLPIGAVLVTQAFHSRADHTGLLRPVMVQHVLSQDISS